MLHHVPDHLVTDLVVFVAQDIANAADLTPVDVWLLGLDLVA